MFFQNQAADFKISIVLFKKVKNKMCILSFYKFEIYHSDRGPPSRAIARACTFRSVLCPFVSNAFLSRGRCCRVYRIGAEWRRLGAGSGRVFQLGILMGTGAFY